MDKSKLLLEWMRETPDIEDKMLWKKAAEHQMCFFRDQIAMNLLRVPVFAVSQHMSKSILLPVYGLTIRNGIEVYARENFYGWVVSLKAPSGMRINIDDYVDLFIGSPEGKPEDDISSCYCEGFREDWVFHAYKTDCGECTFRVDTDYQLYTLMYILNRLKNENKKEITPVPDIICETLYKNILEKHNSEHIHPDELFHLTQWAVYQKNLPYEETKDKELWEFAKEYEDVRKEFSIEVKLLYDSE